MKFASSAVLCLFLFATPAFANCRDSTCLSISIILSARSTNFSHLKGNLHQTGWWQGIQKPLGMDCSVIDNGNDPSLPGYEYTCNTVTPKMTDEARRQMYDTLATAFRAAAPGLIWRDTGDSLGTSEVGGLAADQLIAKIFTSGSSVSFLVVVTPFRMMN
jgi:hypothetical protein